MLTCINYFPATNGTWLYILLFNKQIVDWADTEPKQTFLQGVFYGGNMIIQSIILYPFFHMYNYELARQPSSPLGVPYVTAPHFMACYSLLLTTAAITNFTVYSMEGLSQSYRESEFLMQGKSITLP